tara:strand:+ start:2387 stop:4129 length:1743 start_codon:yes stop_codon:yes gene_type:complete
MSAFNNKVEILRALETTKDQFNSLIQEDCEGNDRGPVSGYTFSEDDKDFMEEFKKVSQLGLNQLERFIGKLKTDNQKIDEYSILYYIRQLLNGPFGHFASVFANGEGVFSSAPDIMGSIAEQLTKPFLGQNFPRPSSSTPVFTGVAMSVGADIYNKSPRFVQQALGDVTRAAGSVFNQNFVSSIVNANTLPYIDKQTRIRISQEPTAGFAFVSNGGLGGENLSPGGLVAEVAGFAEGVATGIAEGLTGLGQNLLNNVAARGLSAPGLRQIQTAVGQLGAVGQNYINSATRGLPNLGGNLTLNNPAVPFADSVSQGLTNVGNAIINNAINRLPGVDFALGQQLGAMASDALASIGAGVAGKITAGPTSGVATGNWMLKDVRFFNKLKGVVSNIFNLIDGLLGPDASRLLNFKKTQNYFDCQENTSITKNDSIPRLLVSTKKVYNETGDERIETVCREIETNLLGGSRINDESRELKIHSDTGDFPLYTTDGQGSPIGVPPPVIEKPGPDDYDDLLPEDLEGIDFFKTCEEATARGQELGCEGCHSHEQDGETYFMPCNSMEEYEAAKACEFEKECPDTLKY